MTSPVHGATRALRAAGFGTAAVALALAAHAAAGGGIPSLPALVVTALFVGCASVLLTGRRLGRAGVLTALGTAQLALHLTFSFLSAGSCAPSDLVGQMPHGGYGADPMTVGHCTSMTAMHGGVWMVAAHVVATVLTAALLAHGERALWVLATLVPGSIGMPAGLPSLPRDTRLTAPDVAPAVGRPTVCSGGTGRRGPPVHGALAA